MKNSLKISLLILYIFILPLLTSASNSPTDTGRDDDSWKAGIMIKEKEIAHFKELTDTVTVVLDKKLATLVNTKEKTESILDQLRFAMIVESRTPYQYRKVLREVSETANAFRTVLYSSQKTMASISTYIDTIEQARKSLDSIRNMKDVSPDILVKVNKMDSDLGEIKDKLSVYQQIFKEKLANLDTYEGISVNKPTRFNEIVFEELKEFYLTPSLDFFNKDSWLVSMYFHSDWLEVLKLKFTDNFPDSTIEIVNLLICILGALILFFILKYLIYKILKYPKNKLLPFRQSLLWAILAIGFILYSFLFIDISKAPMMFVIGLLFLTRAIMFFGWGLTTIDMDEVDLRSIPFAPLFWLYFYGYVLEFLDQYFVYITLSWIIGLIVFMIVTYIHLKKVPFIFERYFLGISIVLGAVSIILSLVGFVYTTILAMMAWFLFSIGIQFARHIKVSLGKRVQLIKGKHVFLKILFIAICIPALWLVIMLLIFMWGVGQVFGTYFFLTFIKTSITIDTYTINFSNLVFVVYLYFVFRTMSNIIKVVVVRLEDAKKIESGAAPSIAMLINYGIWFLYIVIMLKLIGINMTSFAVITGGLSVGIGFGLKEILNNFVSGLIILCSHSIKHGDIIDVGGVSGKVIEITIRTTVVKTFDNAIVSIPNANIISASLTNWTNQDLIVRKDINIGVAYGSDLTKVKSILLAIANDAKYVMLDPAPTVYVTDFADSSINLLLRVWISDMGFAYGVLSAIREKIYEDFNANKIEIPFPQMDIHMTQQPPSQTLQVGKP